jgi:16S rRNA (guanine527-N7)-methyltransferase
MPDPTPGTEPITEPATATLLQQGVAQLGLTLSLAQYHQLMDFLNLMLKWNKVYNLTALREPMQMITHHILDTLAAAPAFANARLVLDVGAGGGVPGLILAIVYPKIEFHLIDIVTKKTAFLTQAKLELGLKNVVVHTGRVEALGRAGKPLPARFDIITSRAFAELADFVAWSCHLLSVDGQFIALKGTLPENEIARLPAPWRVRATQALHVPELNAERHLIWIDRNNAIPPRPATTAASSASASNAEPQSTPKS